MWFTKNRSVATNLISKYVKCWHGHQSVKSFFNNSSQTIIFYLSSYIVKAVSTLVLCTVSPNRCWIHYSDWFDLHKFTDRIRLTVYKFTDSFGLTVYTLFSLTFDKIWICTNFTFVSRQNKLQWTKQ